MDSMSSVTDTVFVRGIPPDTTDEQLLERFADVGPVKHAYCLRDKKTHRAKYGFVKFAIREDAQVAVDTLSGALLNGKVMMVENAVERGANDDFRTVIEASKKKRRQERSEMRKQERDSKLKTVVLWAPPTEHQSAERESDPDSKSDSDSGSDSDSDSGSDSDSNSDPESESDDNESSNSETDNKNNDNILPEDENYANTRSANKNDSYAKDNYLDDVRSLLTKHSLNSSVVTDGSKKYGVRACLATFPSETVCKNAYRRLKKVAADFFPKREFNMSSSIKAKNSCRVIIRNLAWKATQFDIKAVFSPFGPLRSVHLPREQEKSRGYCFLQYWSRDDAVRAVQGGNGLEIHGRQIAVDFVNGKKEKASASLASTSSQAANSDVERDGDKDGESNGTGEKDEKKSDLNRGDQMRLNSDADNLTLFIRNLPYGTGEDELYKAFRPLGILHYAKIVMDKKTNRSMGTAFVRFKEQSSVAAALSHQPPLSIGGRDLIIARAVTREKANELRDISQEQQRKKGKKEDKRHLYLAREGKLSADMEAEIPKQDVMKRRTADKEKQSKLTNPNFFVSPTRLSVRNICTRPVNIPSELRTGVAGKAASAPGSANETVSSTTEKHLIDSKILRSIFLDAAKKGLRQNLVRDNEGDQALMPSTKTAWRHVRIVQSKVISEGGRGEDFVSRGYGFVEFGEHAHALAALRMLNNNPHYFWCAPGPKATGTPHFRRHRLIVEFAVENAKKLAKRARKLQKQKKHLADRGISRPSNSKKGSSVVAQDRRSAEMPNFMDKAKRRHRNKRKQYGDSKEDKKSTKRKSQDFDVREKRPKLRKIQGKNKDEFGGKKDTNIAQNSASLVSSIKANATRWFE